MSENGGGDRRKNEEELESRSLNIGNRRFYIDAKQNSRGRFIKITEMGQRYKSRLSLSMVASVQVRDKISEIMKFAESLPPHVKSDEPADDKDQKKVLMSETIVIDQRRYYLDLKENSRDRFLRIAQVISNPTFPRSQVAIPVSGLKDVRDALSDLVDTYSADYLTEPVAQDLPKLKVASDNNKTFFLDVGQNDRGTFVRLSEVKLSSGYRAHLTIPKSALENLRDAFDKIIKDLQQVQEA